MAGRGSAVIQRVAASDRRSRSLAFATAARQRVRKQPLGRRAGHPVEQAVDRVLGRLLLARFAVGMPLERRADELDLLVRQMLDADELLPGLVDRAEQLV